MSGVELRGLDAVAMGTAVLLIIASYPIRVWMFRKLRDDNSVRDLLDEASMIGSDFLAFRLVRRWPAISRYARWPVLAFCLTQLTGALILLLVSVRTFL